MAAQEFMHAEAKMYSDYSGYPEHPIDMLNRLSREGWTLVQSFSLESHLLRRDAREEVKVEIAEPDYVRYDHVQARLGGETVG